MKRSPHSSSNYGAILASLRRAQSHQVGLIYRPYTCAVRRLFQLGTMLLLLTVFLAPVFEFFDRWDAPGLNNDVEMAVFSVVLLLSLLLAACTLIRRFTEPSKEDRVPIVWPDEVPAFHLEDAFTSKLIVPPISAPLRL